MKKIAFSCTLLWLAMFFNLLMALAIGSQTIVHQLMAQDLSWEDIGRGNLKMQCILVGAENSRIIFAGSSGDILKSDDAGSSWRSVLTVRRNINAISFNQLNPNIVYSATDNGLYRSDDLGGRWSRIFRGKNNLENQCTAVLDIAGTIFVGTRAGLFISSDGGRLWHKENERLGSNAILNIDASKLGDGSIFKKIEPSPSYPIIYLAATSGIFKSSDNGKSWEKIFAPGTKQLDEAEAFEDEGTDEPEKVSDLRFVKADINNIDRVYFSCAKGVYKSPDQGKTWGKLTEYGLLSRDVKMFCLSGGQQIFALTQLGVFIYQNERWIEASFGLADKLNYLALDDKANLYVAGEKGLFKAGQESSSGFLRQGLIQEYLKYEPKIKDVQEAAIKYAEVSPEKISQWRKKAAKKALLPQVSVGIDRNTTDLRHWEGGSTTKENDDILRRGRDSIDWDVSLSWDLSDLIWNDAQTSIDVRSKLMVELRDDILDQVNKLYFERLRLKLELDNLAIEDKNKRFDKQLKVEELTASLDALTSGYYSEQLAALSPGSALN